MPCMQKDMNDPMKILYGVLFFSMASESEFVARDWVGIAR
jgi:hypothetical protein